MAKAPKFKNLSEEFIRKTNKLILLVDDEKIIEIFSILKEDFKALEEPTNEFVATIDANINTILDRLPKELKGDFDVERVAETFKEIKVSLVKRVKLLNETI